MATFSGELRPIVQVIEAVGPPPRGSHFVSLTEAGLDADEETLQYLRSYLSYLRDNDLNLEIVVGMNVPITDPITREQLELALEDLFGKPGLGESFVRKPEFNPDVVY